METAALGLELSGLSMSAGSCSVTGKVRRHNEDSFLCIPGAYVVADGMGGHNAGDVASRLTVRAVEEWWGSGRPDITAVPALVRSANAAVRRHASTAGQEGMGSTLVGAFAIRNGDDDSVVVVNVGDSRCYVLHEGRLEQVTKDHSYVQELVDQGLVSQADAATHPERNVVTRAIGVETEVVGDFFVLPELPSCRLLLCSDGVSGEVAHERLAEILAATVEPGRAAELVIAAVMEGRAADNATALVVDVRRHDLPEDDVDVTGPLHRPADPAVDRTVDRTAPIATGVRLPPPVVGEQAPAVIATVPLTVRDETAPVAAEMIDEVPGGRRD